MTVTEIRKKRSGTREAIDFLKTKEGVALTTTVLRSAPIIALGSILATIVQWNLEHVGYKILDEDEGPVTYTHSRDLPLATVTNAAKVVYETAQGYPPTTPVTSKVDLPARKKGIDLRIFPDPQPDILAQAGYTTLSPPVLSTAARLADAGCDAAVQALRLAEVTLNKAEGIMKDDGVVTQFLDWLI